LTVEADEGGDWMLRESRRFAHSPAYLRRLAHENDLRITALDREMLRSERGAPVAGLIAALTR
jgi:predicted TPR repeat methyltransferase